MTREIFAREWKSQYLPNDILNETPYAFHLIWRLNRART